jgi:hypothetical protein
MITKEQADRMIELLEKIDKNMDLIAKVYRVSIAGALAKAQVSENLKKPPVPSDKQPKLHDKVQVSDDIKITKKYKDGTEIVL